jgi:predicted RNase H-like nuclease (RuvC/YqgF family)
VQMHISENKRDKIAFQSLTKKQKDINVGIDLGTTIDIAALDLGGNLVYFASVRLFSPADLIRKIANLGKPLILVFNKAEMPFGVGKIRCSFSVIALNSKKDILIKDKCILTRDHNFKNNRKCDLLSTAMCVYRTYKNEFESILKRAKP